MAQKGTLFMEPPTRAEILLHDYNRYRAHTFNLQKIRALPGQYVRDVGPRRGLPIFGKLDAWCAEQHIDPRRWLYHLFKLRKWIYAPPLTTLIPTKESAKKRLAAYQELMDTPFFSTIIHQGITKQRQDAGEIINCNRDLIPLAETRKKIHLGAGRPDKCMAEMQAQTYGYHPKSLACARCPLAQQCAAELQATMPFDIMALRRGEMTLQQAQVVAQRAGHAG